MERTTRADSGRGRVPGLAVRRSSRGETTYWLRWRRNGRMESMTFKDVGLAAARLLAKDALNLVTHGGDPRPKKAAAGRSLGRCAVLWLRSREAKTWKPRTLAEMRGLVRRNVLPGFRRRNPNEVERGEVWKSLRDLANRAPVTANRAFAAWRMLYRWLHEIDQEYLGVKVDPTAGLKRPGGAEKPRDRTYSDAEIKKVLAATKGTELGDLVDLLVQTGTRDAETRAMRWEHVDLDRKLWTVPGDLTKNGKPHEVPLSSGAVAVFSRRDRTRFLDGRVFPFTRPQKAIAAASKALGFDLRLHDLRRTVGDRLRQEYGEATMHAALGHADARLTATYGPSPRLRSLADALEWWSGEVARIRGAVVAS